ncbi:MAG: flagellar basal body L-ring protein FlgH, partial [Bryobacteraceae bacterium]
MYRADRLIAAAAALSLLVPVAAASPKEKQQELSELDRYILEAGQRSQDQSAGSTTGSLWSPSAPFGDLAMDLRARNVDDIVTILVAETASAVAKGTVSSARSSDARASVDSLLGPRSPTGRLGSLIGLSGESRLEGEGETSRETLLRTTLTARVTHVLPNGFLVVEGLKQVTVNSETQLVKVRGIVRPVDLSPGNSVFSDRVGQLEVSVNGKGVVGDSVRRPNFLYRLL